MATTYGAPAAATYRLQLTYYIAQCMISDPEGKCMVFMAASTNTALIKESFYTLREANKEALYLANLVRNEGEVVECTCDRPWVICRERNCIELWEFILGKKEDMEELRPRDDTIRARVKVVRVDDEKLRKAEAMIQKARRMMQLGKELIEESKWRIKNGGSGNGSEEFQAHNGGNEASTNCETGSEEFEDCDAEDVRDGESKLDEYHRCKCEFCT